MSKSKSRSRGGGNNSKAILRSTSYLWKYRGQAALPYVFLLVATLAQLAVPRLIRNIIDAVTSGVIAAKVLAALNQIPAMMLDQALPKILTFLHYDSAMTAEQLTAQLTADKTNAPTLLMQAGLMIVGFAVLRGVFSFLQAYWAERNSQAMAYDLRNDLYAKIQRLSFSYHDQNQTGQLMIRATDDVEKLRLFLGQGLLQLVGSIVLLVITLIILFSANTGLALATIWILPVALILFMIFGTISQPLFARVQQKLSALNTILQENLAGIKVVKAFTREKSEQVKFNQAADVLMAQQITIARLFTFLMPFVFLIANLGQATTLFVGGKGIIVGTLTLGEWQEFSMYLMYLFFPIAQLGFIITQFGQAAASATRIFEILDAKSDVKDKPDAIRLPPSQGHIKFENVSFRYIGTGEPVLSNVSFAAEPGQTIALLGATGSGKTSIINLLPRFYDPTDGKITIDGYDLRDVTLESLRAQIGNVLQETTLFTGTIRDNIAFGKPEASDEEIIAAAKAAAAHDFILSFPEGYATPVGERGTTLSGGQKQRVAIARALLLNPRILILDDSTSSVDLGTEAVIQTALEKLMQGRTSFVIAQRISTVINADQIIVLDKGQVAAIGKHADLLENNEIYAEIYSSQLLGDEDHK
ncbi:MAG: ABC transporter ATP-binding protein [Anaerolineae bacterium CG_4_9_14_3_um_filter_57_17]|nr:ABC transporter ATP-binding protein [bacterium]NCT21032.1 ABC transporter ATP-binding protein [bacterium]OIO83317.1 MAG: ABC transporter ATP-binding protein [Anaerolineae bacterium CG2_30_57_67]PJB67855.1 MAG: ABC transporter ATP-binding protein [Anaerolineae bacterium CG_4_9_14_3_um_filter_57_17]